jgi:hypothetical protein
MTTDLNDSPAGAAVPEILFEELRKDVARLDAARAASDPAWIRYLAKHVQISAKHVAQAAKRAARGTE